MTLGRRLDRMALATAMFLLPVAGNAEEPLLIEETFLTVDIRGQPYKLEALVAKEAGGRGRLPVALIMHGQSAELERREKIEAAGFLRTARDLARRGWLAVVVIRRGFGRSGGQEPYTPRRCRDRDYGPMLDQQTDDMEAVIKAIAGRPDADVNKVLALGVSMGGAIAVNLAARQPQGLQAVVNISGGIRTRPRPEGTPGNRPCTPDDLARLFARLGEKARLPALWLYSQNDSYFPADVVRRLHESYVSSGGRVEFHMFEPIGEDGHKLFSEFNGLLRWLPALDRFLRANKLPTYDPGPLEAVIRKLKLSKTRAVARRYAGRPTEKALAVSLSGKVTSAQYGERHLEDAEGKSIRECERLAKEPCQIVLRNFESVTSE